MFKRFKEHIVTILKKNSAESLLVAVSGGVDSMVLCHLLDSCDIKYAVAHVNHNTRSGGSDKDEEFVTEYFKETKVHVKRISINKNVNFHDTAHKERYLFFSSLGYDKIMTAHHNDDQAETVFVNFLNGRSLNTIVNHDDLLRPMLHFSKEEILQYASDNKVRHIVDKSNLENTYLRNLIRNEVLPLLHEKLDVKPRILSLSDKLIKERELLHRLVDKELSIDFTADTARIDKSIIATKSAVMLKVAFRHIGINLTQCRDLLSCLSKTGSFIDSSSHRILVDREEIIIKPLSKKAEHIEFSIDQLPLDVRFGRYQIQMSKYTGEIDKHNNNQYIPSDLLTGNLIIRAWQHGDRFRPLGLNGKSQSIKKFFTNQKVDRFSKATVPLLVHNGEIVLILGHRSSDTYKVADRSSELVKVSTTLV